MTELEQLQAENAQLKAHNRQMIQAIQTHMDRLTIRTQPGMPSEAVCDSWEASELEDAIENPDAKLAMAEAEVLRAAEAYYRAMNDAYSDGNFEEEQPTCAVEAMQEARKDA